MEDFQELLGSDRFKGLLLILVAGLLLIGATLSSEGRIFSSRLHLFPVTDSEVFTVGVFCKQLHSNGC
jgi:hypothetical protein